MSWWFAACILLPLAAGQNIAPAFRPDSVTTVTGQIWCGNSPAGSIAVEWWTDRGNIVIIMICILFQASKLILFLVLAGQTPMDAFK